LKLYVLTNQPYIRAKIIGAILIAMGIIFLLNPTDLNVKIGFTSIIIGIFMIVMITEKSIPKKISDAQAEGNLDIIKKMLKDLDLNGNAVFLPKSDILNEERILIPPNKEGVIEIPDIHNNALFLKGINGKNLGISIPPAGLKLLKEIDKEVKFENTEIENINEKLQIFVGMDLLKSVSFRKLQSGWSLEVTKPMFKNNGHNIHNQYPCPICSAVIIAVTRSLNEKMRIYNVTQNGDKIIFYLNIIKQKSKQGE